MPEIGSSPRIIFGPPPDYRRHRFRPSRIRRIPMRCRSRSRREPEIGIPQPRNFSVVPFWPGHSPRSAIMHYTTLHYGREAKRREPGARLRDRDIQLG